VSKRPNVLLAHPGTQYAPQLARELFTRDALSRFVTGFAIGDSSLFAATERLMPAWLKRGYAGRRLPVPAGKIDNFIGFEASAIARLKLGAAPERVLHARNESFQNAIPEKWIAEATHVIGFDTSSWILAQRSAAIERPFILDRSIGHPRAKERVYENVRAQFPEWAETIPGKKETQMESEDLEHRLATQIVVPSRFVRDTLIEHSVPAERITIIPFGTNLDLFHPANVMPPAMPFVFLYAGGLSARKGLPVLLSAWEQANISSRAELWLVGSGKLPESARRLQQVRHFGRVGQTKLAALMRRAHAFVFPSFFEGLAQVQIEALSSGLPVIGTYESGATEIVSEGETGFVVPAGSVSDLADRMAKLAADIPALARARDVCIRTRERLSWRHYGDRWISLLDAIAQD
jgi:alpha-maltose-1-phosphate synthase